MSFQDSTETAGTMTHMAPESFNDINESPKKSLDVYSFGITLWELSTGKDPFECAQNDCHIRTSVLDGQRPDMKCFPQDELPIIKEMMLRAWNQTPAERPTFLELKEEIEKEYEAKYKKDIEKDRAEVYKQLAQRKEEEEEPREVTWTAPWSKDIPDSSSLPERPKPGPLHSSDQPGMQNISNIPEKAPVTVSDKGEGELPGVSGTGATISNVGFGQQPQDGRNDGAEGDSHAVNFAGSTDTRHGQKEKKGKEKKTSSSSSSDSESDNLDPELQKIMDSTKILKEKDINKLHGKIGLKWRDLGRRLGFQDVSLDIIEFDQRFNGLPGMAHAVLVKFVRLIKKKGELARALVKVGLNDVALKLK